MTDAHCHVSCGDHSVRELLVGRDFFGVHPWETMGKLKVGSWKLKVDEELRTLLIANPKAGVGEIGLDRLKCRDIPPLMREVFEAQLALAFELGRPVVLHGAKCWGQVVKAIVNYELRIMKYEPGDGKRPSFLFHGFSRSDGLIPDIVKLGGFISVGAKRRRAGRDRRAARYIRRGTRANHRRELRAVLSASQALKIQ